MALQKHLRHAYYHLPIHCGYCGQRILTGEDAKVPIIETCPHTLYVGHSEGLECLADRVVTQLQKMGYDLEEIETDGLIEVYRHDVNNPDVHAEELAEILTFDDGIVIEAVVGAPSGMSTYVAYAPLENEGDDA